jgi:hypothetical protein
MFKDPEISKLEQKFAEGVHHPDLQPLLQATRGLMRFLPSSRIIADEALDLIGNTNITKGLHQTSASVLSTDLPHFTG